MYSSTSSTMFKTPHHPLSSTEVRLLNNFDILALHMAKNLEDIKQKLTDIHTES